MRFYTDKNGKKRPIAGQGKHRYKCLEKHGPRYRLKRTPGYYTDRDARGRFRDVVSIHRSIARDAATKAKTQLSGEPGHGMVGDYRR